MKNTLLAGAPDSFTLSYLEAAEGAAFVRYLPLGPFFPTGPWAEKLHLFTGELARWRCGVCDADNHCKHWAERTEKPYLNIVVSSMGAQLGLPKTQADFAPDSAELNPELAMHNPSAVAAGNEARKADRMAYVPETAFGGCYADGQTNVAVLKPVRAKRPQLMLDFGVLKKYDLLVAPTDVADRFRQLDLKVIGCDPSSFAVTVESLLP